MTDYLTTDEAQRWVGQASNADLADLEDTVSAVSRYATPAWADRQFTGIMSLDAMIEAHAWPRIGIA